MSATPTKKKLCWNCDGNVPLRAEHCPYCGVYIEQSTEVDDDEIEEEEAHTPPFHLSANHSRATSGEAPAPPYGSSKKGKPAPMSAKAASKPKERDPVFAGANQKIILPLLLLICGSVFALFGLVLLLFSENGVFVLKWNGDHWPVYLVVGVLFLLVGWRFVGKVDEQIP